MDKDKFNKIKWENFLNHPQVKYYTKTLYDEWLFAENLMRFVEGDEDFRKNMGIDSLTKEEALEIARYLKKTAMRRGAIKALIGLGAVGIGAGIAKKFSIWPFGSDELAQKEEKPAVVNDSKKLFEEFKKIPELNPSKEPRFSNNPDAPIIILIEDSTHRHWHFKFQKLEILRQQFGLTFVGLEGWAGQEGDRKRGRQILNADVELIKGLINNKDYKIIGLEEPKVQIQALELYLANKYRILLCTLEGINEKLNSVKISLDNRKAAFEFLNKQIYSIFETYGFEQLNLYGSTASKKANDSYNTCMQNYFYNINNEDKSDLHKMFSDYIDALINIINSLNGIYEVKSFSDSVIRHYEQEMRKKYPKIFMYACWVHDYQIREFEEVVITLREKIAATKMLDSMRSAKQKAGIVVFGNYHTLGFGDMRFSVWRLHNLIDEFVEQANNNINVIVLQA